MGGALGGGKRRNLRKNPRWIAGGDGDLALKKMLSTNCSYGQRIGLSLRMYFTFNDCHRHTEERMIAKYSQEKSSLCVVLLVTLEAIEKVYISHRNEATTKYVKYDD